MSLPLIAKILIIVITGAVVILAGTAKTNTQNDTITQPSLTENNITAEDITKEVPNFLQNLWDMITAGVTGVANFFAKLFVFVLNNYVLKYLGIPITLPMWIGYIAFLLIMAVLLMTQWENLWSLIHNNLTLFLILLSVVFILGITLKMVGAI